MTKEDKQLLLKDLCARLPYHPIVYVDENLPRLKLGIATRVWEYIAVDKSCKPYLRSMSSMTEEEKHELYQVFQECPTIIKTFSAYAEFFIYADIINSIDMANVIDWLNAHHFDYRGLIGKGLALESPKGMYNLNK